jgi:hypothetical protein
MGKEDETLPEELPAMSPSSIEDIVEWTYKRFLSGDALDAATDKK